MPQMVRVGPLQKFDLHDQLWFNPNAFLHLIGHHTFAPARPMLFGEIDERAFWDNQWLQLLEELAPRGWHESVSCTGDVDQVFPSVVADNYRVQTVRIAADNEFLPSIDAILDP